MTIKLMEQKDKDLLLKELCAKLPYGIKVQYIDKYGHSHIGKLMSIDVDYMEEVTIHWEDDYTFEEDTACILLEEVKPYLRPMSSMTEEEKDYVVKHSLGYTANIGGGKKDEKLYFHFKAESYDWLNEHHFDYRGLIDRGLAIEVTKDNNIYKD